MQEQHGQRCSKSEDRQAQHDWCMAI